METTSNRRRSQRLFLQTPVVVEGQLPSKSAFSETTHTIVVNAHGALVQMAASLELGQVVTLKNARTGDLSECVVKFVTPMDGKFNTALEFTKPHSNFWHVSFPPEDWTMKHPDAKKNH
jgi:gamma-glutamylcysteine synthetase